MENSELPLVGQKITLRSWERRDVDAWAIWMEPGHLWKELDAPYYPLLAQDERTAMLEQRRGQVENGPFLWPPHSLVIADGHTNAFLGVVTWYWESKETCWPGLGIVVYDEKQWRQGIGYEAVGLWTDFLFHALPQIVRLDLRTWSGNPGMMRLAEKLGYVEEARFRRARIVGNAYYDGLGYGVLREEWLIRYPQGFSGWLMQRPPDLQGGPA